jgi:hypothetical protein
MYGAGYDMCEDKVYSWLLKQPRATDGFNKLEMEYRVLELLDWQLNVATEHDLVGHLVGSLQPTIAAEIRDSTTISTRRSLALDDGWTLVQRLRDPSAYAVQNVKYALLQRAADESLNVGGRYDGDDAWILHWEQTVSFSGY